MKQPNQLLNEIDRTKEMMDFSTKPKKVIKPEPKQAEETITEGRIISLSEFVKG